MAIAVEEGRKRAYERVTTKAGVVSSNKVYHRGSPSESVREREYKARESN